MESEIKTKRKSRRKVCRFCSDQDVPLTYRDPRILAQSLTSNFKILPRRITGTCALHQRRLTQEIKRARILAYIPFTTAHN